MTLHTKSARQKNGLWKCVHIKTALALMVGIVYLVSANYQMTFTLGTMSMFSKQTSAIEIPKHKQHYNFFYPLLLCFVEILNFHFPNFSLVWIQSMSTPLHSVSRAYLYIFLVFYKANGTSFKWRPVTIKSASFRSTYRPPPSIRNNGFPLGVCQSIEERTHIASAEFCTEYAHGVFVWSLKKE